MKVFFDILLHIDCLAMIVVMAIKIKQFPARVKEIDPANNKKNKPLRQYRENAFALIEVKLVLLNVLFFAVGLVLFFLGSAPSESEKESTIFGFVILFLFIFGTIGSIFLYRYFLKTAKENDIFNDTELLEASSRRKSQLGVGVLIMLYSCFTIFLVMFYWANIFGWV